jgi:hypothetical protein
MDGANNGAAPTGTNAAIAPPASTVEPGSGYGGDSGKGFHSRQPISEFINRDPTEQTHTKEQLQEEQDLVEPFVPSYQRWLPSPFERYVPRPTSSGNLPPGIPTYQPEDRSKMGVPLNPFWIRNGVYWGEGEADIFVDADINWVAPRVAVDLPQKPQGWDRDNYINNQEQPQNSAEAPDIQKKTSAAPAAPEAGGVTGTGDAAIVGETKIKGANPADAGLPDKVGKEEGTAKATPPDQQEAPTAAEKRKSAGKAKGPTGNKKAKVTQPQTA